MAWVNAEMITTAVISESEDPPNIRLLVDSLQSRYSAVRGDFQVNNK